MDRYYIFTDYSVLNTLIKDKFDILNEFRKRAQENHLSLTLSMGISYGDGNHNQIGQIALENLNTALVRGGDQIVVRENDSSKKHFTLVVVLFQLLNVHEHVPEL